MVDLPVVDPIAQLNRLYGPHWAAPLARDIAREESTVYGWKAAGKVPKAVEWWLERKVAADQLVD